MSDSPAIFSMLDAQEIVEMLRWWRGLNPEPGSSKRRPLPMMSRMAKLTKCGSGVGSATGYGEIQFYTGNPHNKTLDTSLTVKCSANRWFAKNQDVWVSPCACPDVHWVVVAAMIGPTFFEPLDTTIAGCRDGTLAAVQDCPNPLTTCTDSVPIP
jgi:hypothetical protein